METKGFFQFDIVKSVLVSSFHLYTYVIGLQPLYIIIFFSAGIDFTRQIMTSKVDPQAVRGKLWVEYHT